MLLWSPGLSLGFCGCLGLGASLGLDKPPGRGRLGSPVVQIPEKSGLPSAIRGEGMTCPEYLAYLGLSWHCRGGILHPLSGHMSLTPRAYPSNDESDGEERFVARYSKLRARASRT